MHFFYFHFAFSLHQNQKFQGIFAQTGQTSKSTLCPRLHPVFVKLPRLCGSAPTLAADAKSRVTRVFFFFRLRHYSSPSPLHYSMHYSPHLPPFYPHLSPGNMTACDATGGRCIAITHPTPTPSNMHALASPPPSSPCRRCSRRHFCQLASESPLLNCCCSFFCCSIEP